MRRFFFRSYSCHTLHLINDSTIIDLGFGVTVMAAKITFRNNFAPGKLRQTNFIFLDVFCTDSMSYVLRLHVLCVAFNYIWPNQNSDFLLF